MLHCVYRLIAAAVLILLVSFNTFSQSAKELIEQGISFYDKGEYQQAISIYQKALALEPTSALAHYEIALTYQTLKDYQQALAHSKRSMELDDTNRGAYVTMGSALDDLGRPKEAIEIFEKCLKKFGSHYLVHYNLALTLYRMQDFERVEKNLLKSIELNPSHASSHLLMANVMRDTGKKTQSMLGYYYFLLLEPSTERSKEAYTSLLNTTKGDVIVNSNDPQQIMVNLNPHGGSTQMMMALMQAAKSTEEVKEKNKNKSQAVLFVEDSQMFFQLAGSEKVKKKDRNLWNQLYIPLFSAIANTDHIQAFCYYVSQASSEESTLWIHDNKGKLDQFALWLDNRK